MCFGRPTYGRLGRKDVELKKNLAQPVYTTGFDDCKFGAVLTVAGGSVSSSISKIDGRIWLWGFGQTFMLGKGKNYDDSKYPEKIKESRMFHNKKIIGSSIGGQHIVILVYNRNKNISDYRDKR